MDKVKHTLKKGLEKVGRTELGTRQEDRKPAFETAWTTSRSQHANMTGGPDPSLAREAHIGHPTGLPSKNTMTPPTNKPKYY
ncbi:hypothetical protein C8A01DRAFT_40454 [Parachaetomium inaequale]|uniref:Uncharacterized protein n=1 Tax=Parachaetomium inaequale TaxID=2588326 RepID=A0AAN6PB51_9PEZI|nr:hypothetical protein C8A01DRAFT_40454 [Parachaetomium inaequale]